MTGMASVSKKAKTSKRNRHGRAGNWLKPGSKVKGVSFYVAGDRRKLDRSAGEKAGEETAS